MQVPRLRGVIRRRLLVNFRVEADVLARVLPTPFRPELHAGYGIAGVCLIRLEELRPEAGPRVLGLSSENAAHRVAVRWGEGERGVFIPRRDTDSRLTTLVGGRLFPGEHHRARFDVEDDDGRIALDMESVDGSVGISVRAREAAELPSDSVFDSLDEASGFFERGSLGYSCTRHDGRFDGLTLETPDWRVTPLDVEHVRSSWFEDADRFPAGSAVFDHALLMRDVDHAWVSAPDLLAAD